MTGKGKMLRCFKNLTAKGKIKVRRLLGVVKLTD